MMRLAIIGTGNMAANHAENFSGLRGVKLTACCDLDGERAKAFAARWKIPHWYADPAEMLSAEELDAVSVVTPDASHAAMSLAVIERGLPVMCEKPLATTLSDARRMRDAARRRGVVTHVNFSYRNAPCAQAAAALVRGGGIGRVLHVEASYLQSWLVQDTWGNWKTDPTFTWRLSKRHGSAGTLGDIGCHIYDLAALICGGIEEISCRLATFDKGMPGGRVGPFVLDANDSFVSTVRFQGGAVGTVHATRWATGQLNSLKVRVYGEDGAVDVDLDRSTTSFLQARARAARKLAEWKTVKAQPSPTQYQRFVSAVQRGSSDESDFSNGAVVQAYLDASFASDRSRRPVKVRA